MMSKQYFSQGTEQRKAERLGGSWREREVPHFDFRFCTNSISIFLRCEERLKNPDSCARSWDNSCPLPSPPVAASRMFNVIQYDQFEFDFTCLNKYLSTLSKCADTARALSARRRACGLRSISGSRKASVRSQVFAPEPAGGNEKQDYAMRKS